MELVDMLDSKSGNRKIVWVRVPSLVWLEKDNVLYLYKQGWIKKSLSVS